MANTLEDELLTAPSEESQRSSDAASKWCTTRDGRPSRPLTCVGSVVSLQLAALGEGLGAGQAVEDPGLLGAGGGARLVHPLVFLATDASICVNALFSVCRDAVDIRVVVPPDPGRRTKQLSFLVASL